MGIYTEGLTALVTVGGATRFNESQFSGLKANSLLLDIIMTPKNGASWSFASLDGLYLSANLRQKDADSLQLLDNVMLSHFLTFSDFQAGVSLTLESDLALVKTSPVEISGLLDFGYIQVGNEESVELLLTGTPVTNVDIQVNLKWIFVSEKESRIYGYKSYKSTGGEQADRDVQGLYIMEAPAEISATIRDLVGSQTVNVRDAVALANAVGRFEAFTNFGVLYADPFGVSQDISCRLDAGKNLFLQQEFFNAYKSESRDTDTAGRYEAVLQAIYTNKPEKYAVLQQYGKIPSGFVPK